MAVIITTVGKTENRTLKWMQNGLVVLCLWGPLGAVGGGIWEMSQAPEGRLASVVCRGLQCLAHSGVPVNAVHVVNARWLCPADWRRRGLCAQRAAAHPARPAQCWVGWAQPERPCLCLPVRQRQRPGRVCLNELLEWPVGDERVCGERCWQNLKRASGGASWTLRGELRRT